MYLAPFCIEIVHAIYIFNSKLVIFNNCLRAYTYTYISYELLVGVAQQKSGGRSIKCL